MKVARIGSPGPVIRPFGEHAGALMLLHETVSGHQERCVREAGAELVEVSDSAEAAEFDAAFAADVLFDTSALKLILGHEGPACAAVEPQTGLAAVVARYADSPRSLRVPLWKGDPNAEQTVSLGGSDNAVFRVDPRGPAPHLLTLPLDPGFALPLESWVDYLDSALLVLLSHTRKMRKNKIGKNVRISRSAHVERSIIADGASVDNGASVIDSYIGPDCTVAAHTVFHSCVVGAGCNTLIDSDFRRSVFMSGSTVSNVCFEDSVVGRSSFVTTAVSVYDQAPGAPLHFDGRAITRPSLGVAVGHNVTLGARALFEAGVSVPNGSVIVMRPDEGITKLTDAGLKAANCRIADPADTEIV